MRPLLCAGLAALGAGLFLVGSSLRSTSARVVGANAPIDARATEPRNIDANNSPTLVRSPVNDSELAVVNRVDTPRFSCALHVSSDGGDHWRRLEIPFPQGEESPPRCFAPDAAFGADGALHVSFVTLAGLGNAPNAAWITSAPRGTATLSAPTRVAGPRTFQLRLSADPERAGRLYLSWLQASETGTLGFPAAGNPIVVSRSDDGGDTWSAPVVASGSSRPRVVAPSTVVGPGGEVHLLYLDVGDDTLDYHGAHQGRGGPPYPGQWALVLARSRDGGQSWQESVVEPSLVPTQRFIAFFPPSPSLAVDGDSGNVYVAFQDGRMGDADVQIWVSADGGTNFAGPRRVNDTPAGDGTSQYLPKLAVAPNGRLDIVYYDRRADPADVQTEVSFQSSFDLSKSFTPRLRLSSRSFDSRIGFGSERDLPDLGSRLALIAGDARAMAVWADTRSGTEASGKQDLARAVVAFATTRSGAGQALRIGGPLLAGAALVLLLMALLQRRREG